MTEMQIQYRNLQETRRHNKAGEELTAQAQAEVERANRAREAETYRYNVATLAETQRANMAKEALQEQANVINASHYANVDAETVRSNVARETETHRANIAKEAETYRANKVAESQRDLEVAAKVASSASQNALNFSHVKVNEANRLLTESKRLGQDISNVYAPAEKSVNIVTRFVDSIMSGLNELGRAITLVK